MFSEISDSTILKMILQEILYGITYTITYSCYKA